MLGPLAQVAVTFHDVPRAMAWYRDVLGLPLIFETNGLVFFAMGDVRLMMTAPEQPEHDHPASVLYFKVANIDESYTALAARGATLEDTPHLVGKMGTTELWMFFVRDPERHLIGISEERAGP
ncbi:MAG TPA: VOC family protein [Gemmatimonadaceae bacterium]|jgi:methylmalonyl-CoA/ethylmalonyl-CoA epimerase